VPGVNQSLVVVSKHVGRCGLASATAATSSGQGGPSGRGPLTPYNTALGIPAHQTMETSVQLLNRVDNGELDICPNKSVEYRLVGVVENELLAPRLEVRNHGLKTFGCGEVRRRDVAAVDYDGAAIDPHGGGLVDHVPHIVDGREGQGAVRRGPKVVLAAVKLLNIDDNAWPGSVVKDEYDLDSYADQDSVL